MTTTPDLPVELHAEIVQHLHHYQDRSTLLSAALVNKDWRTLSQRILFSAVTDHWYHGERRDSVRATHTRFLRAVIESPDRLGPLVKSYAQDELAYNPAATGMLGPAEPMSELWALTAKALPAMVNLKHLYLNPLIDSLPARDGWASSRALLSSFAFRLITLTWRSHFHPDNGVPEFLRMQHNLIHLENGRYPFNLGLAWLEDGVCPRLVSVTGGFTSFRHVARSRQIVAWKWYPTSEEEQVERVLGRSLPELRALKYLSIYNYENFRACFGPLDLNIHLLELGEGHGTWIFDTPLANLPSVRVLVLIQGMDCTTPDEEFARIAVDCFKWLPSLEYVLLRYARREWKEYRYVKLSRLQGSTEDIVREKLNIHYDVGAPWWTIYNV